MIFAAAAALVRTLMSISGVNDIFATKYDKNKATNQDNSCWNGEIYIQEHPEGSTNRASAMDGGSDISGPELSGGTFCQNIDSQIQRDENSATFVGVQQ